MKKQSVILAIILLITAGMGGCKQSATEDNLTTVDVNAVIGAMPKLFFAVRNNKDFLLTEYSSDTVYRYTQAQNLIPVLVRKPSIQTVTSKVILHSWLETNDYTFFTTNRLEIDWDNPAEFQEKGFLIERNTGNIYQSYIEMNDYKGKNIILGPSVLSRFSKETQTGFVVLPSDELLEAEKEGKLSGILKEKVNRLTENDESVVMIMRFK